MFFFQTFSCQTFSKHFQKKKTGPHWKLYCYRGRTQQGRRYSRPQIFTSNRVADIHVRRYSRPTGSQIFTSNRVADIHVQQGRRCYTIFTSG